jgi:hypothetical protein
VKRLSDKPSYAVIGKKVKELVQDFAIIATSVSERIGSALLQLIPKFFSNDSGHVNPVATSLISFILISGPLSATNTSSASAPPE